MVAFIERPDSPEIPPPYDFPGIQMFSFRLPAKLSNLQKLCDNWLNIGTLFDRGFEDRAFAPFVDMEILTYPENGICEVTVFKVGVCKPTGALLSFFHLAICICRRNFASGPHTRAILSISVCEQFMVDD